MLTAIQFYDRFCLWGAEVSDVIPDGMLTAEVYTQLIVADSRPEFALSRREIFTEYDGPVFDFRIASSWTRHFAPSVLPHLRPAKYSGTKMGESQF